MNILKRIPIHYKGELHDVHLINFSVDMDEIRTRIPAEIAIRDFNGRAMISMVDVKLQKMRPSAFPLAQFNYRHLAFRLLVDDSACNGGKQKGIYFFRSFTNKRLIVTGGRLMTDYNLEFATIEQKGKELTLSTGQSFIRYVTDENIPPLNEPLMTAIGALDRAYAVFDGRLRVTEIQREKWPIKPVNCPLFENTFFKTAKFEGAFKVHETIYYDWLPPKFLAV